MKNTHAYHVAAQKLRLFFLSKGFLEVPTQSRLSILAACEDPETISSFEMQNTHYPLPQTGQMWLEHELLKNPDWPGVFCFTTSYRNEPHPIAGRHDLLFPLVEFERKGTMNELLSFYKELMSYLHFNSPTVVEYEQACKTLGVYSIEIEEEKILCTQNNSVVSLINFPQRSHPFWNMKHDGKGLFKKVDLLLYGMETIGSAERSCDKDEMRHYFHTVSDGKYAQTLFKVFGKERVYKELDEYLSLAFFPRFGGGIGMTRLVRAYEHAGLPLIKKTVAHTKTTPQAQYHA